MPYPCSTTSTEPVFQIPEDYDISKPYEYPINVDLDFKIVEVIDVDDIKNVRIRHMKRYRGPHKEVILIFSVHILRRRNNDALEGRAGQL